MRIGQRIKIPKDVKVCDNFFSRIRGLMFFSKPKPTLLVFPKESKVGIHMLFVFFPLDIIWLDSNYKIVAIRKNVRPFSGVYYPKTSAKYVLELPVK